MVAPKVPTPGSTTCFARSMASGSLARSVLAPSFLKAASTEARFRRAGRQDQHISHDQRDAFGARHVARSIARDRLAKGQCRRLERGFGAMMIVVAADHVHMERCARRHGERGEDMGDILGGKIADALSFQAELDHCRRAGRTDR